MADPRTAEFDEGEFSQDDLQEVREQVAQLYAGQMD